MDEGDEDSLEDATQESNSMDKQGREDDLDGFLYVVDLHYYHVPNSN